MGTVVFVFLITVGAYAINTWKIREIARSHRLGATLLEGLQAAAFVLVITLIAARPGGGAGLAAYILAAMVGTGFAMREGRRGPAQPMALAKIRPERSCRLVEKPCPWCGGVAADGLEQVVVLLDAGAEVAYGYRCPWCGSCVVSPARPRWAGTSTGTHNSRRPVLPVSATKPRARVNRGSR